MTKKGNLTYDEYDYIEINEQDYNENKEYIQKGFGESIGIILYILKHKKGNFYKKIVRRLGEELEYDKEHYDIYAKYFVTQLKCYDEKDKENNECFDHFKIDGIGFYKITDFYKNYIGGLEENKELEEKSYEYEKNYIDNTTE